MHAGSSEPVQVLGFACLSVSGPGAGRHVTRFTILSKSLCKGKVMYILFQERQKTNSIKMPRCPTDKYISKNESVVFLFLQARYLSLN